MKKFMYVVTAACLAACMVFAASCGTTDDDPDDGDSVVENPIEDPVEDPVEEPTVAVPASVKIVMPDGAPALSMAQLMYENYGASDATEVSYEVVDSSTISTYVTGTDPEADICVLPVNLASKLLGTGETYQMLGSVTHGNLYLLSSTYTETITQATLSTLIGKTVGVVQLANVPGLVFKSILADNGIAYNEVGNDGTIAEDKVNLQAIDGTDVGVLSGVDYYVAPEPAASTKVGKIAALQFVGDLQELYDEENGYVQAVLVAKTSFIQSYEAYVSDFLAYLDASDEWLETTDATTIVEAVSSHLTDGLTPTFNANNFNSQVLKNCGIDFVYSVDCKDETNEIIAKFISLNASAASTVSDAFYNLDFGN